MVSQRVGFPAAKISKIEYSIVTNMNIAIVIGKGEFGKEIVDELVELGV